MNGLFAIILGTAPALLWLVYFYRRDRFEPEPVRLVLKTFAWGALGTVPAAAIESLFALPGLLDPHLPAASPAALIAAAFGVVAPVEEGIKFLAVRLTAYRSPEFDEPVDGLIYASSAALGFAAVENIVYVSTYGSDVVVARALLSTLGHVVVSAPWGLTLGLRRSAVGFGAHHVGVGLVTAVLFHGTFDYLLFLREPVASAVFILFAVPGMIIFLRSAFRRALPLSQYAATARCQGCLNPLRPGALFCPTCGRVADVGAWRCPACGSDCRSGALFCGSCGRPHPTSAAHLVSVPVPQESGE